MKHPRRRLEDELHDVWNDWINDNDYGLWHDVPEVGALGAAAVALGAAAPPVHPGEMLDGEELPIVLAAGGRAAVAEPGEGPRRAPAPAVVPVAPRRRGVRQTVLHSAAGAVSSVARGAAALGVSGLKGAAALGVSGLKGAAALGVRAGKHILRVNGLLPPSRSASVAPAARAASRAPLPESAAGTGLPPASRAVSRAAGLAAPNAGGGLRLNAGGRVVNSQGRFVSQQVAALYLQRHPPAAT